MPQPKNAHPPNEVWSLDFVADQLADGWWPRSVFRPTTKAWLDQFIGHDSSDITPRVGRLVVPQEVSAVNATCSHPLFLLSAVLFITKGN